MCATVSNFYNVYNNNYNNNCPLDILLCLQSFCKQQYLFVILLTQLFTILLTVEIFKPQLFSSHAMHLHTRLTELLLLVICLVLFFIYDHANSLTFSISREFHCCLCILFTLLVVVCYCWFTHNKFNVCVS